MLPSAPNLETDVEPGLASESLRVESAIAPARLRWSDFE
jgi:hypothetical protein